MREILNQVRDNYGLVGFVALVVVTILLGVWLGYTPDQVVEWLGL